MARFHITATLQKVELIIADSPQEAVLVFRKVNPDFQVDCVDDDQDDSPTRILIGFCEHSGEPIFDNDDYVEDEHDVKILRKYIPDEFLSQLLVGDETDEEEETNRLIQRTENNMNVISEFLEHLKEEAGIEIPEEHLLSFFNA